jgi:hypothetical protein
VGSFFLETAQSDGLSNYVIRGNSVFGSHITVYRLMYYITLDSGVHTVQANCVSLVHARSSQLGTIPASEIFQVQAHRLKI